MKSLFKKGMKVKVCVGKDKGKTGEIIEINRFRNLAKVKDVNMQRKHKKATKENKGTIKEKVKEDLVNIFVPTTPNPTSGFLLMLPKKDLIYLDVSFEQASKFIVSAGTTNID